MTVERDPRLDSVLTAPPKESWQIIFEKVWEIFSAPLTPERDGPCAAPLMPGHRSRLGRGVASGVPRHEPCLLKLVTHSPVSHRFLASRRVRYVDTPDRDALASGRPVHRLHIRRRP